MKLESLKTVLEEAEGISDFEKEAFHYRDFVIPAMEKLRTDIDALESMTASSAWPFPSYGELLFGIL